MSSVLVTRKLVVASPILGLPVTHRNNRLAVRPRNHREKLRPGVPLPLVHLEPMTTCALRAIR